MPRLDGTGPEKEERRALKQAVDGENVLLFQTTKPSKNWVKEWAYAVNQEAAKDRNAWLG